MPADMNDNSRKDWRAFYGKRKRDEFSYKNLDNAGMRKAAGDKAEKAYLDKAKKEGKFPNLDLSYMAEKVGRKKSAALYANDKAKFEAKWNALRDAKLSAKKGK